MRACKKCKRLSMDEACPTCKGATTQYWTGYLGVVDPEKSDIGKRMEITQQGHYALKVR